MSDPIEPAVLARLMDEAVGSVRPRPDALSAIHRGVRRRRTERRAAAALTLVLVLGGGAAAYGATRGPRPAPPPVPIATPTPTPSVPPARHRHAASAPPTSTPPTSTPPASPTAQPNTPTPTPPPATGTGVARLGQAVIQPVGNPATTNSFELVVDVLGQGQQTIPFTATNATYMPPKGPVITGADYVGPGGNFVIFVQVDAGAATQFWSMFTLANGHVVQVTMNGQPARLAVGGSVMTNGGFSCGSGGAGLVTYGYSGAGLPPDTWSVQRDTYSWSGASLVHVSHQQATIHAPATSPRLAQYTGIRCGSL